MSTHLLGIDFGTANVRVYRAQRDGTGVTHDPQAPALRNSIFDALPSVIEVDPNGGILRYGKPALDRLANETASSRFIQEFKPCLGQRPEDLARQGRPAVVLSLQCSHCSAVCSPESMFCHKCGQKLSGEIDAVNLFPYTPDEAEHWAVELLTQIEADLSSRVYAQPLTSAHGWSIVAGVPAHWAQGSLDRFRAIVAQCFHNDDVTLLTEPEAAMRYHFRQGTIPAVSPGDRILVVDFGAGTIDLAIGTGAANGFESVEVYGERYGGGDFDVALGVYLARQFNIKLDGELPAVLRHKGKELKELFSYAVASGQHDVDLVVTLPVDGQFRTNQVGLTRDDFEKDRIAGKLIREFSNIISRGLNHFDVDAADINVVIATGGGARWYFVDDALRRMFSGRPVVVGDEPERAIAKGLASGNGALRYPTSPPVPTPAKKSDTEPASHGIDPTMEFTETPALSEVVSVVGPIRGDDVVVNLCITVDEARAGCTRSVTGPQGVVDVVVPRNGFDIQEITLKGLGAPGLHDGDPGDLVVELTIEGEAVPSEFDVDAEPEPVEPIRNRRFRSTGQRRLVLLAFALGIVLILLAIGIVAVGVISYEERPGTPPSASARESSTVPNKIETPSKPSQLVKAIQQKGNSSSTPVNTAAHLAAPPSDRQPPRSKQVPIRPIGNKSIAPSGMESVADVIRRARAADSASDHGLTALMITAKAIQEPGRTRAEKAQLFYYRAEVYSEYGDADDAAGSRRNAQDLDSGN